MPAFNYEPGEPTAPRERMEFEPLPRSDQQCIVINTAFKPTKAGTGEYLEVTLQVIEGEYAGRRLWDRLNISNPNKTAEEIAKAQLDRLIAACGIKGKLQQTEQLHDTPILVSVDIDRKDPTRNRIDNYSPIAGAKPKNDSGSTGAKKKPWER